MNVYPGTDLSLNIPPAPAGQLIDVDMRIANLEIPGESTPLLAPYIGQSPSYASGSTSYAGFVLNDVAGVIGKGTYLKSRMQFKDLNNGIIANNSTLLVTNSKFKDIQPDNTYSGAQGFGIRATAGIAGSYVLVQQGFGTGTNAASSFDNCRIGIFAARMSMDISENKMEDCTTGIQSVLGKYRSIAIYNNSLNCKNYGIMGSYNNNAIKFQVMMNNPVRINQGNSFTGAAGIALFEYSGAGNTPGAFVYNNEIHLDHGQTGISMNNTRNSTVLANRIEMHDSNINSDGLHLNTCYDGTIQGNTVTGNSTTTQTAIRTYQTINSRLNANTVDETQTGLYFDENCNDTWMHCNEIITHDVGAWVDLGGAFGHPHDMEGNKWLINGGDYSPGIGFDYDGNNLNGDQFYADTDPISKQTPYPINPQIGLFNNGGNSDPCASDPPNQRPVFFDFDSIIATGSIPMENYEAEYDYMAKTNLFVKAALHPDSIPSGGVVDSFYSANQSTSIGLFTSLHSKSDSLFSLSVAQKELFYTSDSLIVLYLKQIVYNDSLLLESPSVADSIELLNENSKLKEMLNGIIVGNYALLHELDSLQGYYADSLYAENSAISTSETIEDNIRDINAIYYSTLAKGVFEFDSSQQATLYAIGTQCPNSGGKAVQLAQGMYHLVNDTIIFNSDTLCQGYSPRISSQGGKLTKSTIYPNPAQDMATLWVQVPDHTKGTCTLIDPVGREIMKFPVTSKVRQYPFSCRQLRSGIFSYQVVSNDGSISTGKFCIIR